MQNRHLHAVVAGKAVKPRSAHTNRLVAEDTAPDTKPFAVVFVVIPLIGLVALASWAVLLLWYMSIKLIELDPT